MQVFPLKHDTFQRILQVYYLDLEPDVVQEA